MLFAFAVVSSGQLQGTSNFQAPVFADRYRVQGVIILPYAEIRETFNATFDGPSQKSRVDYYGDLVLTVQKASAGLYGASYKVSYMTNPRGLPERVCFKAPGSPDDSVRPQDVFPNLTDYRFIGKDHCPDWYGQIDPSSPKECDKWSLKSKFGEKESEYTFWNKVQDGKNIPVHFKMLGYNTLFGSHYDEYRVAYKNYEDSVSIDDDIFDFVDSLSCRSFPGPGVKDVSTHNPIKEFTHGKEDHHEEEFEKFKNKFNKKYESKDEEEKRKTNFKHNHRHIQSANRANSKFKLAHNHFSDMSQVELRRRRGKLYSPGYNGGLPYVSSRNVKIPFFHDWRLHGAVNPVKDQAVCGSCWSFGTSGTLEGTYFVKTGHLVRVSEQQLIDCSWQQGDNGCDGGEDFRAYEYIQRAGGIALAEDYGNYLGQDGKCHDSQVPKAVEIDGFYNVTPYNTRALEAALVENGPITVAIDASPRSFTFYSRGVYSDVNCKNKPDELDHQVLVVGYGSLNGERYWLVKNSWSTYWGNDGYVLISQRDNMCGVTTSPTFPRIKI